MSAAICCFHTHVQRSPTKPKERMPDSPNEAVLEWETFEFSKSPKFDERFQESLELPLEEDDETWKHGETKKRPNA